jgi:hypothetical protein
MMHDQITVGNNTVTECNESLADDRLQTIISVSKAPTFKNRKYNSTSNSSKSSQSVKEEVTYSTVESEETSTGFYDRDGNESEIGLSIYQRMDSVATTSTIETNSFIATVVPPLQDGTFVAKSDQEKADLKTTFCEAIENDRFGNKKPQHLSLAMIPRLDLSYAENATAWIYARLTIQNFGSRFRFRTDIYLGKCLTVFILLSVFNLMYCL